MYTKTGIIYLYPMLTYTLTLTPEKKKRFENNAKKLNVTIEFIPKKIIIKDDYINVIDWSIRHDIYPFLEGMNVCRIYEERPLICHVFPRTKLTEKEQHVMMPFIEGSNSLPFDIAINIVRRAIKDV